MMNTPRDFANSSREPSKGSVETIWKSRLRKDLLILTAISLS